jgi:hypothetical protein
MSFISVNRKSTIILIIVGLVLAICLSIAAIYLIDQNTSTSVKEPLPKYAELKNSINEIVSEDLGKNSSIYTRINEKFSTIENTNSSVEEKYAALDAIFAFLLSEYARAGNKEYYNLINTDLESFAKKNFKKQHTEKDLKFITPCFDPSCQDTPQPKELNDILDAINNSDLPPEVKQSLTEDLTAQGYRSKDESEMKAETYFIIAFNLERVDSLSQKGSNTEIANLIYAMIKNNFPEEYEKLNSRKADVLKGLEEQLKKRGENEN